MKKLLVLALVCGTAYGAWNVLGGGGGDNDRDGDSAAAAARDVKPTDRLWLDRIPRDERDAIHVFVTLTDERIGIFQNGSRWRASYELFHFEAHGTELQIVYPQTGERERVTAKVTACNDHGMDYCMDLAGASRGVTRYYSMKGWELDGTLDDAQRRIEALTTPRQAREARQAR